MATNEARAILGSGLVQLSFYDDATGTFLGYGDPLDVDQFAIKPDFEKKTSVSKSHKDYGQARATVILPKPTELSIDIASGSVEALAIQFQGVVDKVTQAAATITDEAFTAKLGVWRPISKRNLKDVGFAVTNEAGTTTYVLGTDYEVNWAQGEIKALAAGAITEGQSLKVSGTALAYSGDRIKGGLNPFIRVQVRFDGKELTTGRLFEANVWDVKLGSSNDFDFVADNFTPIKLKGDMTRPSDKDASYEVVFKDN